MCVREREWSNPLILFSCSDAYFRAWRQYGQQLSVRAVWPRQHRGYKRNRNTTWPLTSAQSVSHTQCLLLRMDWSRLIITLQISPNSLLCLRVCKCVCSSCWHNTEAKRQVSLNHYVERVKIWGREVAGKRKMKQMRSDEWDVGCSVEVLMCASMSGGGKPQEKQGDEIQMRKNG